MSQYADVPEPVGVPARRRVSGVVDGSVVTSFHPDGTVSFHVAVGHDAADGDCFEMILDGTQAQAVLEAWHRFGASGAATMLPATRCQVGVQRHPRWATER